MDVPSLFSGFDDLARNAPCVPNALLCIGRHVRHARTLSSIESTYRYVTEDVELTEDFRREAEQAERNLEYRALERRAARKHLKLSFWTALGPALAATIVARVDHGASAETQLAVFLGSLVLLFSIAWLGVAFFYWFLEFAEDA